MKKYLYLCSQMRNLTPFKIDLKSMKDRTNALKFDIDDDFFEALEAPAIHRGKVDVALDIQRVSDFFKLHFHCKGVVEVICDMCLDNMDQPIETDDELVVRFGSEYEEKDDLVTIPEEEGIIDVAWFIYEFIALGIPIRHVHEPGNCNAAMMDILKDHSVSRRNDDGEDAIDPRWKDLLKLKN